MQLSLSVVKCFQAGIQRAHQLQQVGLGVVPRAGHEMVAAWLAAAPAQAKGVLQNFYLTGGDGATALMVLAPALSPP